MNSFHYEGGELHCEGVSVKELVDRHSTPLYIYSKSRIEENLESYKTALKVIKNTFQTLF